MDLNIEPKTIIELVMPTVGVVGMWFTMRERLNRLVNRDEAQEKQHEENQKRMAAIELQIARDCVKVDDFRRLDDRFSAKFEKVEHAINNASLRTVGMVKDMLREFMPSRAPRGGTGE